MFLDLLRDLHSYLARSWIESCWLSHAHPFLIHHMHIHPFLIYKHPAKKGINYAPLHLGIIL